jgi:hypothetical protein
MIDEPVVPTVPVVRPGTVLVVVGEAASGGATVGITGTAEVATAPVMGNMLGVGIVIAGLTPRLAISLDPNGIPVRAPPPNVVGDVDVGVEDEAMLLEPEPHIPDIPAVSSIPDVVDIPDVAEIPDDIDVPAATGVAVPIAIPPPS